MVDRVFAAFGYFRGPALESLSDDQANKVFSDLAGATADDLLVGVPTWTVLETCSVSQLRALHDSFVTGQLDGVTSSAWRAANPQIVAAWNKRISQPRSLQNRREIAWHYRREVDQRQADVRERRMEAWAFVATLIAVAALVVAVLDAA